MRSFGLALDLRDDPALITRYRKEHEAAWPAVLRRLREIGVTEMKIFLLGRHLFMYCEAVDGFDPERDFPRALDDPEYRKWDELMRTMQERVPEAKANEWWAAMQLVFDLGWPPRASGAARP